MFTVCYIGCPENWRIGMFWLLLICVATVPAQDQPQDLWTLEDSIRRVIEIAPETRGAQAAVNARQGALEQAGAWPNPQIELRADNKIGKDEGTGGNDFTQFSIGQALPLSGRLGDQRAVAGATLEAARAERRYQQVRLEGQVAQHYHTLQLATGRLRLAEQRNYSEETARLIDSEVKGLIDEAQKRAHDILTAERQTLEQLASLLQEREVIGREELVDLLNK